MAIDFKFRKQSMKGLPTQSGVYVLCDLDNVPIYVGQSTDGIRKRVARHLTSARSDVIANRQIDVWEIAYVWAYAVPPQENRKAIIKDLEAFLFSHFNSKSQLMNGSVLPETVIPMPAEPIIVQVLLQLLLSRGGYMVQLFAILLSS